MRAAAVLRSAVLGNLRDALDGLDPRRAGAWLVSYPKSGGTWLNFMLALALQRAAGVERPELTVRLEDVQARLPDSLRIRWSHDDGEIVYEDGRRPDPWSLFTVGSRRRYRRGDVVLLVRDPRDVALSYFKQVTRRAAVPMEFASASEFLRDPLYGLPRVLRFLQVWERNLDRPRRSHVVRYETLLADGPQALGEVLAFYGIALDPAGCAAVVDASRADRMRALEAAGQVGGMRSFGQDRDSMKVRNARAGGYRTALSDEDLSWCQQQLDGAGRPFGYGAG